MIHDIEKLKQIKADSKKIMDDTSIPFSKRFKESYAMLKPVDDWAEYMFEQARKKSGKTSIEAISRFVLDGDGKLASLVRRESDMTSEEREINKKQRKDVATLWSDDDFIVTAIVDYDMDVMWCKYVVEDKKTGFFHRNALGLKSL